MLWRILHEERLLCQITDIAWGILSGHWQICILGIKTTTCSIRVAHPLWPDSPVFNLIAIFSRYSAWVPLSIIIHFNAGQLDIHRCADSEVIIFISLSESHMAILNHQTHWAPTLQHHAYFGCTILADAERMTMTETTKCRSHNDTEHLLKQADIMTLRVLDKNCEAWLH